MERKRKKLSEYLSPKVTGIMLSALSVLLFLPVLWCFFFDYANGDDLYEGAAAHRVLVEGGGIRAFFTAVWDWAVQDYLGWEGNWSSIILWCLEPSIWGEKVYLLTPFIAVFFLIGGSVFFLLHFAKKYHSGEKTLLIPVIAAFLLTLTQNMPNLKNGFFWYTGMVNYVVPFGCLLYGLVFADRFLESRKKRYLVLLCLIFAYMGGAGYPPIVLAFEFLALLVLWQVFVKKEKRALWLLLPLFLLGAGFVFSAVSPGNAVRGGEDYGFSAGNVFTTLLGCITAGAKGMLGYFLHARFLYLLIPVVVLATYQASDEKKLSCRYPIPVILLAFLLSCSVYAPEIYAKDDVSGGVPDTYFFTFLFAFTIALSYLTGYVKQKWGEKIGKDLFADKIRPAVIILAAAVVLIFGRHFIADTSGYLCYHFIASGQLSDFDAQMKERLALLNDPEVTDVVLPEMNDQQGPFMHMPVTSDPGSYTSRLTAMFYGKNSVIAIPREEWEALYGK